MGTDPYRDSIYIDATPDAVFRHFTDADALASWMGDRASVDPRPGGHFIVYFERQAVEGRYIEVDPPRRLVISWGRNGSTDFGPGSSTLEIVLRPEGEGTHLEITHWGLPHTERERHALGWRHYVGRLATLAVGGRVERHQTPEQLTRGVE